MDLSHYILPKFSKSELQKMFGVRRITCFAIDFKNMEPFREKLLSDISDFSNNFQTKPDLTKFRYADDSMFSSNKFGHTLIKKWNVLINPKNNKKKIRAKSVE